MCDNRANLSNANIDYETTSPDDVSYEGAILEWVIIGQTSQTLILTMQRLPEMTTLRRRHFRVGDNMANLPIGIIGYATTPEMT